MPHTYDASKETVDPGDLKLPQGLKPVMWDDGTGQRTPTDFWTHHDTIKATLATAIGAIRLPLAKLLETDPDALWIQLGSEWETLLTEVEKELGQADGSTRLYSHALDGRMMVNQRYLEDMDETIKAISKSIASFEWTGPRTELDAKKKFDNARDKAVKQINTLSDKYDELTKLYERSGCVYHMSEEGAAVVDVLGIAAQEYKRQDIPITTATKTWDILACKGAPRAYWEAVEAARTDFDTSSELLVRRHLGSRPTISLGDTGASAADADADDAMLDADYESDEEMADVIELEEEATFGLLTDERRDQINSLLEESKKLYRRATPLTQQAYGLDDGLFVPNVQKLNELEQDMEELTNQYLELLTEGSVAVKIAVKTLQSASLDFLDSYKNFSRVLQDVE